jgi:CheY-like chemotaxis protein
MKKILVTDDNVMMRKLIIHMFRNEPYEFVEACNGRDCLKILENNAFDLVITDIIMPEMEGIEMIIRAKRLYPEIKIIAISGSKPYYLYMAKKLGIEGVFTKPLNHHKFVSMVNNILKLLPERISKAG